MNVSGLVSLKKIQEKTGRSRSYVYGEILPKLDVRKVGHATMATEESFAIYLQTLPRVTFPARSPKAA